MIGHTKVPDHLSDDRLGNVRDSPPPSCCVLLAAACTKPGSSSSSYSDGLSSSINDVSGRRLP